MIRSFELRMLASIARKFPGETQALGAKGPNEILNCIQEGIKRAHGYGIEQREDVAAFVELLIGLSADFDRQQRFAWARRILTSKAVPAGAKMRMIYQQLPQRHPKSGKFEFPRGGAT